MPAKQVRTAEEEKLWERAKSIVDNQYKNVERGSKQYWRLVSTIYSNLKGGPEKHRSQLESSMS